jgi:hypothetical protein
MMFESAAIIVGGERTGTGHVIILGVNNCSLY